MRPIHSLASLLLVIAVAACTGTGSSPAVSPTSAGSVAPSVEPSSEAPSASASASPSASASASASASESASASAGTGTRIDVVGTEYAYSDFDAEQPGPVTFAFRNEGAELHELVLVKKNDGVTESFEQLLQLPEDEANTKVAFVGATVAEPGQTAPDLVSATEPGEYLMICFIPQGTTTMPSIAPDASGPPEGLGDGPPHFTLGMLKEFTIAE